MSNVDFGAPVNRQPKSAVLGNSKPTEDAKAENSKANPFSSQLEPGASQNQTANVPAVSAGSSKAQQDVVDISKSIFSADDTATTTGEDIPPPAQTTSTESPTSAETSKKSKIVQIEADVRPPVENTQAVPQIAFNHEESVRDVMLHNGVNINDINFKPTEVTQIPQPPVAITIDNPLAGNTPTTSPLQPTEESADLSHLTETLAPSSVQPADQTNRQIETENNTISSAAQTNDTATDLNAAPDAQGLSSLVAGFTPIKPKFSDIDSNFRNGEIQIIDKFTARLNEVVNDPKAAEETGVVNISAGENRARAYIKASELFEGYMKSDEEMQKAFGISPNATDVEVQQALVSYVDKFFDEDPGMKKSLDDWNQAAAKAAEQNINVVISAGNEELYINELKNKGVQVQENAALNILAMNPYVITAGAINDQGTAENPQDDVSTGFSAAATGPFKITVSANGINAIGKEELDGTSFSAPEISATIHKMLIENPNLTHEQVISMLQQTAYDNPNIDNTFEGAGTLQARQAIEMAKQSKAV